MKNMVMYKKGEDSWVRYIKARINSNLNFIAIAEGSTGIGKRLMTPKLMETKAISLKK